MAGPATGPADREGREPRARRTAEAGRDGARGDRTGPGPGDAANALLAPGSSGLCARPVRVVVRALRTRLRTRRPARPLLRGRLLQGPAGADEGRSGHFPGHRAADWPRREGARRNQRAEREGRRGTQGLRRARYAVVPAAIPRRAEEERPLPRIQRVAAHAAWVQWPGLARVPARTGT